MQRRSGWRGFECEAEHTRGVAAMHRGPAVGPAANVGRDTLLAREADRRRYEPVVAAAVPPDAAQADSFLGRLACGSARQIHTRPLRRHTNPRSAGAGFARSQPRERRSLGLYAVATASSTYAR